MEFFCQTESSMGDTFRDCLSLRKDLIFSKSDCSEERIKQLKHESWLSKQTMFCWRYFEIASKEEWEQEQRGEGQPPIRQLYHCKKCEEREQKYHDL